MANVTATSASYDANANQFFVAISGANSGDAFDLTKFTFTGANGETYTAQAGSTGTLANGPGNLGVGVYITVAAADQANANRIFNANGDRSSGSSTADYSFAVGVDFDTTQAGNAPAASGIGLTVKNWALPSLTSATFNATSGQLTVTSTHLVNTTGSANDITVSKLQLTGQGGSTYTLTSTDVEVGSSAGFTVQLNSADIAAVKALLNKNGTSSLDGTTFKLSALAGWDGTTSSAISTANGSSITVSGFPAKTITASSVAFSADTGSSSTDLITSAATQTISGTTSGSVQAGETVQASVDGGAHWVGGTFNFTSGSVTTWAIPGVTLSSFSTTLLLRVVNATGGGVTTTKAYLLDTTAPVLASASVTGTSLVLTYGEALDAVNKPGNSAFSVLVGGAADAVTAVVVDSVAKTVTLTLATAAAGGQVVTVSYTDPTAGDDANAIQDAAGNDAVSLVAQAVTNTLVAPPAAGDGGSGVTANTAGVTITGPAGGGAITGTAGNDTLTGLGGQNTFYPNGGADTIRGGTGIDTVVISDSRANYSVVHNSDGSFIVRSQTDVNTVISLVNVERITFGSQTWALDVTPSHGKVADLYTLALGRNPEGAGYVYWNSAADGGASTLALASAFVASKEFASLYGNLGDIALITQFYSNAFGRAPDAGGLAFFQGVLAHNPGAAGRAEMLADFVDSPEMQAKLVGQASQGIPLLGT